jgi:transcription-repair coupling factor (superfamily II helicase)
MASARSEAELERVRIEAEDRFGPLPEEAVTLLEVSRLRALCRDLDVEEVTTFRGQVRVRPIDLPEGAPLFEEATYHRTTRTLNLQPAEMGPGLPSWVRERLERVGAPLEGAR